MKKKYTNRQLKFSPSSKASVILPNYAKTHGVSLSSLISDIVDHWIKVNLTAPETRIYSIDQIKNIL
jgi:hypothetical protein